MEVSGQLASVPLGKGPPVPIEWMHWRVEMPVTHTGNLSTIYWLSNTHPSQLSDLLVLVYHIVGPWAACVAPCGLFWWPSEISRQFVNMAYRSQFINSNIQLDEMVKLVIKLLSSSLYFCVLCGSSMRLKDCLTVAGCVTSIALADKYVYCCMRREDCAGEL
jgi:hypothetical protein